MYNCCCFVEVVVRVLCFADDVANLTMLLLGAGD